MKMFKIMDYEDGKLKTLFHGVDGSRTVRPGVDIRANMKDNVTDGSSATTYTSGWHTVETLEQALEYLQAFKNVDNKVVVECTIHGSIWRKEHSRYDYVWLSEYININDIVWSRKLIGGGSCQ